MVLLLDKQLFQIFRFFPLLLQIFKEVPNLIGDPFSGKYLSLIQ